MNWIVGNLSSIVSFIITITAAASAFVISDKIKKIAGFTIALMGAIFTLLNSIQTKTQSTVSRNRADSIAKVNDSLQRRINSKTDSIIIKQDSQYSAFQMNAQATLENINKVTDSLRHLINLENETYLVTTGGKNSPFFQIQLSPFDKNINQVFFRVLNRGKYPIRNLKVFFPFTFNKSQLNYLHGFENDSMIEKLTTNFSAEVNIGNLYPNIPYGVYDDFPPTGIDTLILSFNYHWLQGFSSGVIMFKKRTNGNYYDLIEAHGSNEKGLGVINNYKSYFEIENNLQPK